MTEQTTTDNASGINTIATGGPVTIPDLKVDVKKLPAKTPKKKVPAKRKAERAAKATLKEFKKIMKKELRDTFHVTSLLDFALRHKQIAEYNLDGVINKTLENCMLRLNGRKNLTEANKKVAAGIFMARFLNIKSFKLDDKIDESALVLGKSRKKVSKTEKSLTPKEKKKVKKETKTVVIDSLSAGVKAVGALDGKKTKKAKAKKMKNPAQLDNHAASA